MDSYIMICMVCSLLSNLLDNAYETSLAEKELTIRSNCLPSTKGGNHGMAELLQLV